MFDVRNNPAHWPTVPEWDSGCGVDETWAFSGNIYRPICHARTMSAGDVARQMRFLEDTQIQRSGGDLGYWQASTAPVIVSGGGDPAYHGQYDYAGHYWGYPFYQNGNKYIYFARAWQVIDANVGYPAYTGSGAADYPWQVTHWISGFGTVTNVPTFTTVSSRSVGVQIPRWPVNSPIPPGVQPWQAGFYQNDTPYQPFMGYAEDFAGEIYNNDPYADIRSGDPYQWASTPPDLSSLVENPRPAPGSPSYVDTVDATGNPVVDGVVQSLGSALHTLEASVSDAVGGNGTIFGFSPLMVLGVAGVALWLMTKK